MTLRLSSASAKGSVKDPEENRQAPITTDFCKRAFQLLASCYRLENPPSMKFAAANTENKKRMPEKNQAFQSKIVDLRMRRQQDQLEAVRTQKLKEIQSNVDQISKRLAEKNENIDEAFLNEKVAKPDIPIYLRNAEKFERRVEFEQERAKCIPYKPMNMLEVEKLFTYRLAKAKESGEMRARQRVIRMRVHASTCNVSPYTKPPVVNSAIASPA